MAGTSGVGKTETAITLSNLLYGGEQNMTTINMSEFKEEHKVALLMGSPPGYVGYGEGGVLTEAIRRKPCDRYDWDGVGDVRPFGVMENKVISRVRGIRSGRENRCPGGTGRGRHGCGHARPRRR